MKSSYINPLFFFFGQFVHTKKKKFTEFLDFIKVKGWGLNLKEQSSE